MSFCQSEDKTSLSRAIERTSFGRKEGRKTTILNVILFPNKLSNRKRVDLSKLFDQPSHSSEFEKEKVGEM